MLLSQDIPVDRQAFAESQTAVTREQRMTIDSPAEAKRYVESVGRSRTITGIPFGPVPKGKQ